MDARLVRIDRPERARPVDSRWSAAGDVVSLSDGFPVLACNTASLDDLNSRLVDGPGIDRFRANIVVDGVAPWEEETWTSMWFGEVAFVATKPCSRCSVIIDQVHGRPSRNSDALRLLATINPDAKGCPAFGRNLIPRSGGEVRIGDVVTARKAATAAEASSSRG